ncbi:hypothetical protein GDO78_008950, partial [Eleutherodactylus coqui]
MAMGALCLVLLASSLFITSLCEGRTFLPPQAASQFLTRRKRANSFFEESKAGDLERECIEELCNREEAREIFENNPETEYFYPRYLAIPDQCKPMPCHKDGSKECKDGKGSFTCICKPGWRGLLCEQDINECEDPEKVKGGCSQRCVNIPGSYRCACDDGYYLLPDKHTCNDRNECELSPVICGGAQCRNTPGKYECECETGYRFNTSSKICEDVDECADEICSQVCVNTPGSYKCYCEGRKKLKLAWDKKSSVCVTCMYQSCVCVVHVAELWIPVVYLRFKLPDVTRFSAEFDFRTYDGEGVILYAESADSTSWFLLALREGKIEIQFKNDLWTKVTTGGKAINNGQWHIVSVEEMENSISVKIAKEAVMNINNPKYLFKPVNGIVETKVYIAGLPRKVENLIKPINPRLDGCIRGWNLMNQGALGVKEVIQEKQSKHCLVSVQEGSYYPGGGVAQIYVNYTDGTSADGDWLVNVTLNIRSSTSTGVMFALVKNEAVPLALAIEDQSVDIVQDIIVSIHSVTVARLTTKRICTNKDISISFTATKSAVEITSNSYTEINYVDKEEMEKQLAILDQSMKGPVDTYLGGIP